MDIIKQLRPRWVLLENVPGMRNTVIEDNDGVDINIMDHIEQVLGEDYVGKGEVVCCSNYGVPQLRKRLITIYTRDAAGINYFRRNGNSFFSTEDRMPLITLKEAVGHLPPLEAKRGFEAAPEYSHLHRVPILKDEKYWWIANTPEGNTAYNNQCCNPRCMSQRNPLHTDVFEDNRWQSNKKTPLYCVDCGELLPRPSLIDKTTGERRLIKGFHSAYRRIVWDEPARALTKNYIYEASDNKIHPNQNRVLSMLEALIVQTVEKFDYSFEIDGKHISTKLFAEIIGESVPPTLIEMLCRKFIKLDENNKTKKSEIDNGEGQLALPI
jgi:DNA (cytosine-5)-methyltransferase 1